MQPYEKLGAFYLGRMHDLATETNLQDLLLYDSKDLTTHAVCVGMTGSGKTGLCISLLEEAAIDGIPALIIDPKGDLGNLLLTFPELRPEDFCPGSTAATRNEKVARRSSTPNILLSFGEMGLPSGDNNPSASHDFAMRPTVSSTRPVAVPGCS